MSDALAGQSSRVRRRVRARATVLIRRTQYNYPDCLFQIILLPSMQVTGMQSILLWLIAWMLMARVSTLALPPQTFRNVELPDVDGPAVKDGARTRRYWGGEQISKEQPARTIRARALKPRSVFKPRWPTRAEMEAVLSDRDNTDLVNGRAGHAAYEHTRRAKQRAEQTGAEWTADDEANFSHWRKENAVYYKLRRRALIKVVMSNTPPDEVMALHQLLLEQHQEYQKLWYEELTEEERSAVYQQVVKREAVNKARLGVLEDLLKSGHHLSEDEQTELAKLRAGQERKSKAHQKWAERLTPTKRQRRSKQATERTRERRKGQKQARRIYLDARAADQTINAAERLELDGIIKREQRTAYIEELERIVNDPAGGATEAQRNEWARIKNERERAQRKRNRKKQRKQAGNAEPDGLEDGLEGVSIDLPGESGPTKVQKLSTDKKDPTISGPLQFAFRNTQAAAASIRRKPSVPTRPIQNLGQLRGYVPQAAGYSFARLGQLVQAGGQSAVATLSQPHSSQSVIPSTMLKKVLPAGPLRVFP